MSETSGTRERCSGLDIVAYLVPPIIIVGLLAVFLLSPAFYLEYMLSHQHRETQFVEITTIVAAIGAGAILAYSAAKQWLHERRRGGSMIPGAVIFMALVALAAIFFAGEELSWGQTIFKWKTPVEMQDLSRETNLHNGKLGDLVHQAGNAFIVVMFILLPLLWSQRHRVRLPADWAAGIAAWPVVSCALLAMLTRGIKMIYMWLHPSKELRAQSPFFVDYLGEISEQKEMLIALAMLIYAIYCFRAVRRIARESAPHAA